VTIKRGVMQKTALWPVLWLMLLLAGCDLAIEDQTPTPARGIPYAIQARIDVSGATDLTVTAYVNGTPVTMTGPSGDHLWSATYAGGACDQAFTLHYVAQYKVGGVPKTMRSPERGEIQKWLPDTPPASCVAVPNHVFHVDSTTDLPDDNPGNGACHASNGLCTLRAAIMESNHLPGLDEIVLQPTTYVLTLHHTSEAEDGDDPSLNVHEQDGDLNILDDLTLEGAPPGGTTRTTIDAASISLPFDQHRVFEISATVHMYDLTIRRGFDEYAGAGILNLTQGKLFLTRCLVEDNENDNLGGVIGNRGYLEMTDSEFRNNQEGVQNLKVKSGPDPSIVVKNSLFTGNYSTGPDSVLQSSLLVPLGSAEVFNTTFSGNHMSGVRVTKSGVALLRQVTMTENTGGLLVDAGGSAFLSHTIVAGNELMPFTADVLVGSDAHATSLGHNLIGTCPLVDFDVSLPCKIDNLDATDLRNLNAQLGALANNGGPTRTHALLSVSPAKNAGAPGAANDADDRACMRTDQRGVARPQGAACDIGAYEYFLRIYQSSGYTVSTQPQLN
jgi:CSLREA domain-containing protein